MFKQSLFIAGTALALTAQTAAAQRGSDGTVRIIYWQAASILNPYLSGGTKDIEAASMVVEPLGRFDENGNMVPYLATEIPTLQNGGVSDDLTSITWNIRPDVTWSDGSPVIARM